MCEGVSGVQVLYTCVQCSVWRLGLSMFAHFQCVCSLCEAHYSLGSQVSPCPFDGACNPVLFDMNKVYLSWSTSDHNISCASPSAA